MINVEAKALGLFAHPIGHSLSLLFQNTFAMVYGRNVAYLPFEVKNPEKFDAVIYGTHALDVARLNMTAPYKEAVIPYLCGLSEEARLIGAVNTLIWTEENYTGHNTNIAGMVIVPTQRDPWMEDAHIPLLGAGGTVRSVAVLAATGGAAELVILNRNTAYAEAFAKVVRGINPFLTVRTAALGHWCEPLGDDYPCIQCAGVGIWPDTEEVIVEDPRFFEKLSAVTDIVYTPEETKFLRLARAVGKPIAGGLAVLTSQDAHAFSLWTGKRCTAEQEEELSTLAKRALPAQGKAEKGLRKIFAYRGIQQTIWERMNGGLTYDFYR